MLEEARRRTEQFQALMAERDIEAVLLTEESSIAYFAGYWGYLGVEFGRPSFLLLRQGDSPIVITPLMESEMAGAMTWIERVLPWEDEGEERWERVLQRAIGTPPDVLHVEKPRLPGLVHDMLVSTYPGMRLADASEALTAQRTIKSDFELDIMRQAGRIGGAMMDAARDGLGEDVAEYEVALGIADAGARAAAGFLTPSGWEAFVSPLLQGRQIMQSGPYMPMVHKRAGVRRLQRGDPVYFCFCNLLEFKHYRLGFDRVFYIGEIPDEAARAEQAAIAAQRAALDMLAPGVPASDVARAANAVYREHGFTPGYRTGRSIGMAYLEAPELKEGDDTLLQPGMTFAVDGGVTVPGRTGGRIGDSVAVTEDGFEFLTEHPRALTVV